MSATAPTETQFLDNLAAMVKADPAQAAKDLAPYLAQSYENPQLIDLYFGIVDKVKADGTPASNLAAAELGSTALSYMPSMRRAVQTRNAIGLKALALVADVADDERAALLAFRVVRDIRKGRAHKAASYVTLERAGKIADKKKAASTAHFVYSNTVYDETKIAAGQKMLEAAAGMTDITEAAETAVSAMEKIGHHNPVKQQAAADALGYARRIPANKAKVAAVAYKVLYGAKEGSDEVLQAGTLVLDNAHAVADPKEALMYVEAVTTCTPKDSHVCLEAETVLGAFKAAVPKSPIRPKELSVAEIKDLQAVALETLR